MALRKCLLSIAEQKNHLGRPFVSTIIFFTIFPSEQILTRQNLLNFDRIDKKIKNGNAMVTTHRILFFSDGQCIEIPLHYIGKLEKFGTFMTTDGIKLDMINLGTRSHHIEDYYLNVTKRPEMMPNPPQLPSSASIKFHDKTRN